MPWPPGKPRGKQSSDHVKKRLLSRYGAPEVELIPRDVQSWAQRIVAKWPEIFAGDFGEAGPRNIARSDINSLAAIIAQFGGPQELLAEWMFEQLVTLCVDRARLTWQHGWSLRRNIAALPKDPSDLLLLAASVEVVDREIGMKMSSFSVARFVAAVLDLGTVERVQRHVLYCAGRYKLKNFCVAVVFCDTMLANNRKYLELAAASTGPLSRGTRDEQAALVAQLLTTITTITTGDTLKDAPYEVRKIT